MKSQQRNGDLPTRRKELVAEMNRVVKRMDAMSSKELFRSLVRVGIYTKGGKLTKQYGG